MTFKPSCIEHIGRQMFQVAAGWGLSIGVEMKVESMRQPLISHSNVALGH